MDKLGSMGVCGYAMRDDRDVYKGSVGMWRCVG